MNRNTNAHFANLPAVDIQRSVLDRSFSHKLTGNVADIIPIYVDPDILPGDTVSMDTSKVIRFQTMLSPVMDNAQCDIYWFFVAHRIVWDHWVNFMGENTASAWAPSAEYTIPKITLGPAGHLDSLTDVKTVGSILDYMGVPLTDLSEAVDINALPIRAYSKVMNDWFRSEALTDPLNIYTGDSDVSTLVTTSSLTDSVSTVRGGKPFKAAKYQDYFTSCLPAPQRGDAVNIDVFGNTLFPVYTTDKLALSGTISDYPTLVWAKPAEMPTKGYRSSYTGADAGNTGSLTLGSSNTFANSVLASTSKVSPANLWADPAGAIGNFNVNDLRYAFQLQKLLERDARSGGRYIEVIRSHFGVKSSDARLQRSEYLGGNRFGIVVDQVCNTAQTESDFLGDLGAFSQTSDVHSDFTKSFEEHGTLLGLMVIRYDHTYSQGLQRFWSEDSRFDLYWPVFSNIGEQPVLKKELFLSGTSSDDAVFGYNEAWASYRYQPNRVSGYMRPDVTGGLSSWTFADDYDSAPSLSDSWIREDPSNVDRTLAVTGATAGFQFWADIYFHAKYTRPMPVYSVPGLIDHH